MYNVEKTKNARSTTGGYQDAMRRRLSNDYLPASPKKPVKVVKRTPKIAKEK